MTKGGRRRCSKTPFGDTSPGRPPGRRSLEFLSLPCAMRGFASRQEQRICSESRRRPESGNPRPPAPATAKAEGRRSKIDALLCIGNIMCCRGFGLIAAYSRASEPNVTPLSGALPNSNKKGLRSEATRQLIYTGLLARVQQLQNHRA